MLQKLSDPGVMKVHKLKQGTSATRDSITKLQWGKEDRSRDLLKLFFRFGVVTSQRTFFMADKTVIEFIVVTITVIL